LTIETSSESSIRTIETDPGKSAIEAGENSSISEVILSSSIPAIETGQVPGAEPLAIPVPPPAPPIGSRLHNRPSYPDREAPAAFAVTSRLPSKRNEALPHAATGICLNEILNVKLRSVGEDQRQKPPDLPIDPEELFAVPLRPVTQRSAHLRIQRECVFYFWYLFTN
jgi:hypothetical protein